MRKLSGTFFKIFQLLLSGWCFNNVLKVPYIDAATSNIKYRRQLNGGVRGGGTANKM